MHNRLESCIHLIRLLNFLADNERYTFCAISMFVKNICPLCAKTKGYYHVVELYERKNAENILLFASLLPL